jgi:dTDP-4-amino-4,6-dideoxygalactose transaminase
MIPFLDVAASYRELKSEIDEALARVLNSGQYVLGAEVEAFEAEWAEYCHTRHSVGVASGLDALTLALRAVDVGPGDEVIVPSNTFIATWLAVTALGARPVPVEPQSDTYNMDPRGLADAITPVTRAILPVHLFGQPADLDPILKLARQRGISVIEDAAQAHGASYRGRRIGGHGDVVCWSFFPGKNLGAFGDAGAITTDRADIADRIRLLRNYGSREKYVNEIPGVNSRLDPMQAAILRVKLNHLEEWTNRRRATAAAYAEGLAQTDLVLPHEPGWVNPAWHLYVVRSHNRDAFKARLDKAGVGTLIHYPIPPHMQAAYSYLGFSRADFPIAAQLADEVLSLPMGPHLRLSDSHRVIEVINEAV